MTKKEIVKQIADRAKLTQLKTKEIVQWTFDAIIETLVTEGRIELRNFGVFEVKRRKPRRARNPRTNKPVEVEAKNVVTFQPGKVMEERVRKMSNAPDSKPKRRRVGGSEPQESTVVEPSEAEALVGAGVSFNGTLSDHNLISEESSPPLKPR